MSSLPSSTPDAAVAPGDFDFLIGRWRVAHRRLRQRLAGCTEWDHFTGTTQAWPLMAGFANVDDNGLDLPGGAYRAISNDGDLLVFARSDAASGDEVIVAVNRGHEASAFAADLPVAWKGRRVYDEVQGSEIDIEGSQLRVEVGPRTAMLIVVR